MPKKMIATEFQEQVALMQWAAMTKFTNAKNEEALIKSYLHASPNGDVRPFTFSKKGERYSVAGKRLQRAGVLQGFPDLFLFVMRKGFGGLFIELKRNSKSAYITPEQFVILQRLNREGFLAVSCYGFDEAKNVIEEYLFKDTNDYVNELLQTMSKRFYY